MTQLYKLAEGFNVAVAELNEMLESGEIDKSTIEDTLEGLEGELKDKAINIGLYIKNLRSDLSQYEEAKSEFDEKARAVKSKIEFYDRYLETNMRQSGIDSLKNEYVDIGFKSLPAIVDVTGDVPKEYSTVVPESMRPDKRLIAKKLKDGEVFDFASLVTGRTKMVIK